MYCVDESADEPIMLMMSQIGQDDDNPGADYIDGARFAAELLRLDRMGKKSIQVYINCPGGSVIDGMSIFNAILKSDTPVDTHNVGIAASMGGVCFMAGRKRIMSDYASLMLHNPSGGDDTKAIESMRDSLSVMLSGKSGITKEDVAGLMDSESWIGAAECLEKGFATEIAVTSEHNKKRMPVLQGATAMWKEATKITNNLFINKNTMKKVTAKLKLVTDANEDAILDAIVNMENTAAESIRVLTESEIKLKKDLKDAEDKVTALQAKVDAAAAATAEAKRIADEAEATETETKADAAITAAVKIGKIKNKPEIIAEWKKLAIADLTGTEKIIAELPLNKVSAKIEDVTPGSDSPEAIKSLGTAAGRMIAIANRVKALK